MSQSFGRWFRFYDAVLDDPKVQRLPDHLFRAWINLMCLANRNGGTIEANFAQISFSLRLSEARAQEAILGLIGAKLVDIDEETKRFSPHNWNERQFKSDVSTERVKRFRERSAKRDETASETPPEQSRTETESDTEQSRAEREGARSKNRAAPTISPDPPEPVVLKPRKALRWPADAVVPDDWIEAGRQARVNHGMPEIDLHLEAVQFQNYWASKSGGGATHLDWKKTWINWTLKAYANGRTNGSGRAAQTGHPLGVFGAILEKDRAGTGRGKT